MSRNTIKKIDWNKMSELGLIEKINREILHPVGLAISRNQDNGHSEEVLVAEDGVWEYADSIKPTIINDDELKLSISEL